MRFEVDRVRFEFTLDGMTLQVNPVALYKLWTEYGVPLNVLSEAVGYDVEEIVRDAAIDHAADLADLPEFATPEDWAAAVTQAQRTEGPF